ncbi:MAG TPA: hypothetical protein VK470_13395 [Bacteroidota bacterium]|nr:hypothetical protein [Bacteroidota bacterium]
MKNTIFIVCLMIAFSPPARSEEPLTNFSHLRHLIEKIEMDGDTVSIVHIYANYPAYEWVDAKESGPEGIACVDDAARAAVVFLRHYELTKNSESLSSAKSLLRFVMKMQAEDGQFYNFIFADHTINRTGATSYKSFGWWASRAVWSLASAFRILKTTNAQFADSCRRRIERTFQYIDSMLARYDTTVTKNGYRVPQWLLYRSGADVSSELLLGLVEYARAVKSRRVEAYIRKISEGLRAMQDGGWSEYPYGVHRSWETQWHAWGNGQTQALASAGAYLRMKRGIGSGELEARCFYSRLLAHGMMKEMDVAVPSKRIVYEQIAYGIRPMAVGLVRLYEATHDELYLKLAALAGSWLFGNNILHLAMYDASTGICFDGIRDSMTVNKNSGAESTIEALGVMVEMDRYPSLRPLLGMRRIRSTADAKKEIAYFANDRGARVVLVIDKEKKRLSLIEGAQAARMFNSAK